MKLQDFRFFEDPRFRKERLMWVILIPGTLLIITGVVVAFFLQQTEPSEADLTRDSQPLMEPQERSLTPEEQANRSVGEARQAFLNKEFDKARELLSTVDLDTLQSASEWELAGRLQREAGDQGAAMTSFSKGLALDPSPGLLFRQALLLRDIGKLEEALTHVRLAREKAPGDPVISNEYLLLRIQKGQAEQVTTEIEELIAQTGTLGSEKWVVALAGVFLERGDFAEGARFLNLGKNALDPVAFRQLLENPVLLRHQGRPDILPLYLENL